MRPKAGNDCWYDMVFARYSATLYLSYLPVEANFGELLEDSHSFVYKHSVKADAILEQTIENGDGTGGVLVEIGGNSATPLQFFVTDSVRHFLRGSLYFNSTPNRDSLNPLIEFFKKDIEHLMITATFRPKTSEKTATH
jgi:gliding motility-associated lipoprotein GldD